MEKREYLIILYDFYSELLSDKQKEHFEDYYFNNLSLGEISENENVSRNAIHKSIKSIENKLYFYEEKLQKNFRSNWWSPGGGAEILQGARPVRLPGGGLHLVVEK